MTSIHYYHAHVYYDAESMPLAKQLCESAVALYPAIKMGRMHQKPVGPHPDWSCQLTIPTAMMGEVMGWLALNRKALVLFIHPLTGNALQEHRDAAIWMGKIRPLKLDQFL